MNRTRTSHCFLEFGEVKEPKERVQYINFQNREGGSYEILTWEEALIKVSNPKPRPISISIIINPSGFYYKHVRKAQEEKRKEEEEEEEERKEDTTEIHLSGMTILFAIFVLCYVI